MQAKKTRGLQLHIELINKEAIRVEPWPDKGKVEKEVISDIVTVALQGHGVERGGFDL